jgi:hypothetical protein
MRQACTVRFTTLGSVGAGGYRECDELVRFGLPLWEMGGAGAGIGHATSLYGSVYHSGMGRRRRAEGMRQACTDRFTTPGWGGAGAGIGNATSLYGSDYHSGIGRRWRGYRECDEPVRIGLPRRDRAALAGVGKATILYGSVYHSGKWAAAGGGNATSLYGSVYRSGKMGGAGGHKGSRQACYGDAGATREKIIRLFFLSFCDTMQPETEIVCAALR